MSTCDVCRWWLVAGVVAVTGKGPRKRGARERERERASIKGEMDRRLNEDKMG